MHYEPDPSSRTDTLRPIQVPVSFTKSDGMTSSQPHCTRLVADSQRAPRHAIPTETVVQPTGSPGSSPIRERHTPTDHPRESVLDSEVSAHTVFGIERETRLKLGDLGSNGGPDTMATDPVCDMEVDEESPAATAEYRGETYYFCATGCKESFESDPTAYL